MEKESNIYKEIIEGISQPIFLLKENLVIEKTNPAAYEYIVPTTKLEGKTIQEFIKSDDLFKILNLAKEKQTRILNAEINCIIRKEARRVLADVYPLESKNGRLILLIKDVTQLDILKDKEEKEKKFEAISSAIERIFRKIESQVISIINAINFIEKEKSHLPEELEFIKKEAIRLKFIVDETLEFSANIPYEKQFVNIHKIIEDAIKSLTPQIMEKSITIEKEYTPDIPPIHAEPFELHKAIKNIIKNAVEASPKGKKIEVKTYWMDEKLQPNKLTLCIEVIDEGEGVPKEIEDKLFSPFITTKEGHLGLGLAMTYSIIRKHNGDVKYTREFKKTIFRILIPV